MCRFLRTPAVSMTTSVLPSFSKRTSMLSRVVPGTSDTITRSPCVPSGSNTSAIELTSVLLPAFRLPTIATSISGCGMVDGGGQVDVAGDRVVHLLDVPVVHGGHADRRAQPQPGEVAEHGVGL